MKTRTNATGRPGKIGPAASRFPYSRPPLRDSTQVMGLSKSKAKPSEGTPQGPVDRGFAADYFGASPVASALNLPQERDSPENRNQTITHPTPARSKPDISTLQGIGHFYFALTLHRPLGRRSRRTTTDDAAERDRLVALKKGQKELITQNQAAWEPGITERHVRRLLWALKRRGDQAVVLTLRGLPSRCKVDGETALAEPSCPVSVSLPGSLPKLLPRSSATGWA